MPSTANFYEIRVLYFQNLSLLSLTRTYKVDDNMHSDSRHSQMNCVCGSLMPTQYENTKKKPEMRILF